MDLSTPKAAQVTEKRKQFDTLPVFFQAGLYNYDKYANTRNQRFHPKIYAFNILKRMGNELFALSYYDRALRKYEEALSLFRYIKPKNARWREDGIEDSLLIYINDVGDNSDEGNIIKSSILTCYLNIAACALKLKDALTTKCACDEALKIDPSNSKAL